MHNIFPNKTSAIIIIFLILINIFSWSAYVSRGQVIEENHRTIEYVEQRKNIMSFQKLFVDKVLKANGEVNYETRRELEQAVGRTNDEQIISAWNEFLSAKTEEGAQVKVKNLLSTIADSAIRVE